MVDSNAKLVIAALNNFVDRIIKKLTLDIVANLMRSGPEGGTPVQTGWARANWVPSLTAAASTTPAPQPGGRDKDVTRAAVPGQRAQQELGISEIAFGYTLGLGSVTIANNVPYIISLNDGSSTQAPKAFVQAAIQQAVTVDLPAGFGV